LIRHLLSTRTLLLPAIALALAPGAAPLVDAPLRVHDGSLHAQVPRSGAGTGSFEWNHPEALDLVVRGRAARRELVLDGELETYRALTEGHVYFFVDPEEGERSLIRVDQVAVELQWEAPDHVHQRILGERTETRLPVREFRYYLDRLTLVQYGFGDEIQVGSGLDVAGVPHPLAPLRSGERSPYDFRIVDSLTLTIPGEPEPLRLMEVEVRPRDPSAPGILGTLLLERASGSIVRMAFTFTPASYVDPRTDRISVEVDYGLWERRYWLPNRQEIEVRREMPEIDLGVGTVIRAVLRVGDYELNAELPMSPAIFPPVVMMPEAQRRAYPFREGLLEGIERDGLGAIQTRADPRELRAQAAELLQNRPPTGLSPIRFHLPSVSSALRYNRAEGLFLGTGGVFRPTAELRLRASGGYAFGMGRPVAGARLDGIRGGNRGWELRAGWNEPLDLGLVPAADPLVSSIGAAVRGEDYQDPFRSSGAEARLDLGEVGGWGWRTEVSAGVRRDRSHDLAAVAAPLDGARTFRPLRAVADGDFFTAGMEARRELPLPAGGRGRAVLSVEGLSGDAGTGGALEARLRGRWASPLSERELEAHLLGRSWGGDPLPQGHRLLGGRGSVPGYPVRAWAGRDLALASVEAAMDLHGPLVRLRGGLHAGWAGGGDEEVLAPWGAGGSGGLRPSVTLGLGLGWDVIRIEGARGLRAGEWQLLLSIDPRWWAQL
jgi:hypothetical protein